MFWQVVAFTFTDAASSRRCAFEDALRELPTKIPELSAVRVSRAADQPSVTGYLCGFADEQSYRSYLTHPAHKPIAQAADQLCVNTHRLLMSTDDDVTLLRTERPRS